MSIATLTNNLDCYSGFGLPGCCDFLIETESETENKTYLHGRSMEYPLDTKSVLSIKNRQTDFASVAPDGEPGVRWQSKFGYFGIDILGFGKSVEGFNERGFSVSILSDDDCVYATNEEANANKDQAIVLLDLGDYLLGNCATVEEAQSLLSKLIVWCPVVPEVGNSPGGHFALHDAKGNSAVVEFEQGKVVFSDNPIAILTNSPHLNYQLQNLTNYTEGSTKPSPEITFRGVQIKSSGVGSGLQIPGGYSSSERFAKLFQLLRTVAAVKSPLEGVNQAFHILNSVDKPVGVCKGEMNGQMLSDSTRWVIVSDLTQREFYYRSYFDFTINKIDFKKICFDKGTEHKTIDIENKTQQFQDVTAMLKA